MNLKDTFFANEQDDGDIITTIEPQVQGMLEAELEKAREKWSSDSIRFKKTL